MTVDQWRNAGYVAGLTLAGAALCALGWVAHRGLLSVSEGWRFVIIASAVTLAVVITRAYRKAKAKPTLAERRAEIEARNADR